MANKEIKQTIVLAGEKEYNKALKDAQRNLRVLRSELKAETSELGDNATAQQKNETRARSLKKQIEEQKKVVATLKTALQEAEEKYGDNADVVAKWRTKLNNARATLGDMTNDLNSLESAYDGVNESTELGVVATKSFADSVSAIADVGDSVASKIEDIFTGMIDVIRDAVVEIWGLVGETAAKANAWTDIAGFWNTDTANVEKWARAIEASGNSFADFEAIVTRLNLGGKEEDIESLLGISAKDYGDQWEYAVAVMERMYELKNSGNLNNDVWDTLFGERKATKAMDILNDWETVAQNLERYDADKGGLGMGSETLAQMSRLHEQISTVKQDWQAIQDTVAAGFGTITGDLLFNVSGGLEAINDILNAETEEEREAAIKKLEENVRELFQKVAEAIKAGIEILSNVGNEMSGSDDPVVAAIGTIMKDLANALDWMINHAEEVKVALETIFGIWLVARLASIAGRLTSIIAQINLIKSFSAGSALTGAAGSAGNATGAAGAAGAAGGGMSIAGGLGLLALIAGGFKWAADRRNSDIDLRGEAGYIEQQAEDSTDLQQAFIEYIEANAALQERLDAGLFDGDETAQLYEKVNAVTELLNSLEGHEDILDAYSAWRQENGLGNMDWAMPDNMFGMTPGSIASETLDSDMKTLNNTASSTTEAVNNLPAALSGAITRAIGGITLSMDGRVVGSIVMPYVSAGIARQTVVP